MDRESAHYNNIFNKKNIEFELDGQKKSLPYGTQSDVHLQAYQIIFTSVNNVFQKLLDNDLYNEALLKKYVEYGIVGGPTYANSLEKTIEDGIVGKKYVVSGENGLSVIHKEVKDVESTLSGRFLDGLRVNKIGFQDGVFVACTDRGLYASTDRENWNRVVGDESTDFIDTCYNHSFLTVDNVISGCDYVAVANCNSDNSVKLFGHDGSSGVWKELLSSQEPNEAFSVPSSKATFIKTFENDSALYVGTSDSGLLASEMKPNNSAFWTEIGTEQLAVNDMSEIPEAEDTFERYFLASSNGVKQRRRIYGFENVKPAFASSLPVYDAVLDSKKNCYVAAGNGVGFVSGDFSTWLKHLSSVNSYAVTEYKSRVYVGTQDGVVKLEALNKSDPQSTGIASKSLLGKAVKSFEQLADSGILFAATDNEVFYTRFGGSKSNEYWEKLNFELSDGESIVQLKQNSGVLYAVTNENVYAWKVSAEEESVFDYDSLENVLFAKRLGSKTVFQCGADGLEVRVGSEAVSPLRSFLAAGDKIVDAAFKSDPNGIQHYYFLVLKEDNSKILLKASKNGVIWTVSEVLPNAGLFDSVEKTDYYSSIEYSGLVLLESSGELKILESDSNPPIKLNDSSFKDAVLFNGSIFALSSDNHSVCRFDPKLASITRNLSSWNRCGEYADVSESVLSGKGYEEPAVVSISSYEDGSAAVDAPGGSAQLSYPTDSPNAVDFIGYLGDGWSKHYDLLIGSRDADSGVSALLDFNLSDGSYKAAAAVDSVKPKAFADVAYRGGNGNLKNAFNFVAASDGLFAISAVDGFSEQLSFSDSSFQQFSKANCVAKSGPSVLAATNAGIFAFNSSVSSVFETAEFSIDGANSIAFVPNESGKVVAASNGQNLLISASASELEWSQTYPENTASLFDGLSSKSGLLFKDSVKKIVGTTLSNPLTCSSYNVEDISSVWTEDGSLHAGGSDGGVSSMTINGSAMALVKESGKDPLPLSDIVAGHLMNFGKISENLSVGCTDFGTAYVSSNDEVKHSAEGVLSNSVVFRSVTDADLTISSSAFDISERGVADVLMKDTKLSVSVTFPTGSSVTSVKVVPRIELSGTFYMLERTYVLAALFDSETGEPLIADSTTVVEAPGMPRITVYAGQQLSAYEANDSYSSEAQLTDIVLTGETELTSSGTFELDASLSELSNTLRAASESRMLYRVSMSYHLETDSVADALDPNASFMSTDYSLSLNVKVQDGQLKDMPILAETVDGVYYDSVLTNGGKNNLYGFYADSGSEKIFFDGRNIYDFRNGSGNNFAVETEVEEIGIVHVGETEDNSSFDDVWYFKAGQNGYEANRFRKLPFSSRSSDFEAAKSESSAGEVKKLAAEADAVYVLLKDGSLLSSSAAAFPNFVEAEIGVADVVASSDSVKVVLSSESGYVGSFVSDDEIFLQYEDRVVNENGVAVAQFDSSCGEAVGLFEDSGFFKSKVAVCKESIWNLEKIYKFSEADSYVKEADGAFVSVCAAGSNGASGRVLYAATSNDVYEITVSGLDSSSPTIAKARVLTGLSDVRSVYAKEDRLLVIDGCDLLGFSTSSWNLLLRTYGFVPSEDESSASLKMKRFKTYDPIVVSNGFVKVVEDGWRFSEVGTPASSTYNLSGFVEDSGTNGVCVYSKKSVYQLSSDSDSDSFGIEKKFYIAAADFSGTELIHSDGSSLYSMWQISSNAIVHNTVALEGTEKTLSTEELSAVGNPKLENFFSIGSSDEDVRLAASEENGSSGGVFKKSFVSELTAVENDSAVAAVRSERNREGFVLNSLEFFDSSYAFNYTYSDEGALKSEFSSSDERFEELANAVWSLVQDPAPMLQLMFRNKVFFSNGYSVGFIYDCDNGTVRQVSFSQLKNVASGRAPLTRMKSFGKIGTIAYGSKLCLFDGFSYAKEYGLPDSSKYFALANNFRNKANKILVIDDAGNSLVGCQTGLRYVYDGSMTRSFYNEALADSLPASLEVDAIERVLDPANPDRYLIGQQNFLLETVSLKNASFDTVYRFSEEERVLDVLAMSENEYLIATDHGLYLTSLQYEIVDDLRRLTVRKTYELIDSELDKILKKHVAEMHAPDSLITRINAKADSKLSFLDSNGAASEDLCYYDKQNAVRVVKNDLVDSIVRGGESSSSESYVRVGIKNWAMQALDAESTYAGDGFFNVFTDPSSGKKFDVSFVPYVVKSWKSGLKEIYVYVPTTGTYYANNPQGISNSPYSNTSYQRSNVPGVSLLNSLQDACTTLRVYLYNSYFKIKTILAAQCAGNSLPLKTYRDNVNADNAWKGVFDTVVQPSALRTLPTSTCGVNNVGVCMDSLNRICLDFSIYGTDAQAIRIIAES